MHTIAPRLGRAQRLEGLGRTHEALAHATKLLLAAGCGVEALARQADVIRRHRTPVLAEAAAAERLSES